MIGKKFRLPLALEMENIKILWGRVWLNKSITLHEGISLKIPLPRTRIINLK